MDLIRELENETGQICLVSKEGRNGDSVGFPEVGKNHFGLVKVSRGGGARGACGRLALSQPNARSAIDQRPL
nr:hypothetical protein [Rhizobium sp. ACO-34A]